MTLVATSVVLLLAVPAGEMTPAIVQAPDSPVRVTRARIYNIVADEPAVLMYAATNLTDYDLEEFTIVAYIFDAQGTLKARQTAPGRRTLEKRSTKYSTMVLDGWPVTATDRVVFGVNQALRAGSEKWWHAELEGAAKEAVKGELSKSGFAELGDATGGLRQDTGRVAAQRLQEWTVRRDEIGRAEASVDRHLQQCPHRPAGP